MLVLSSIHWMNGMRFDLEKRLIWRALNPALLFSSKGRTDAAIEYYQSFLFNNATFADMIHPDRPQIIINASDLGYGIRFSFIQEYFDMLCSGENEVLEPGVE